MKLSFDTLDQHPGDTPRYTRLIQQAGPHFLRRAEDGLRAEVTARFAEVQLLVRSGEDLIGAVLSLPLHWNGAVENLPASREEALIRAIGCRELNKPANTLVSLAVVTADPYDHSGLHSHILAALRGWAGQQGFTKLMAVVRPTRKAEHPLTPFEQYINWRQSDGSPFDPALRMHWALGASVVGTMRQAATVESDLCTWETWTDTRFTENGEYIVEEALQPVIIDCENNYGFYQEAAIWVAHKPAYRSHLERRRGKPARQAA